MSSAASWSYTALLTLWRFAGRADEFEGGKSFMAPITISGDYKAEARTRMNSSGEEFVSTMTFYTEYAQAKRGDRIAIGVFSDAQPNQQSAEVRLVTRYGDTLERRADDYMIVT